jgi:hypothetical protein
MGHTCAGFGEHSHPTILGLLKPSDFLFKFFCVVHPSSMLEHS